MIGNKIANTTTKVSEKSQQNNLENVTDENGQEIPKEIYMPSGKIQEVIHILRLN